MHEDGVEPTNNSAERAIRPALADAEVSSRSEGAWRFDGVCELTSSRVFRARDRESGWFLFPDSHYRRGARH